MMKLIFTYSVCLSFTKPFLCSASDNHLSKLKGNIAVVMGLVTEDYKIPQVFQQLKLKLWIYSFIKA